MHFLKMYKNYFLLKVWYQKICNALFEKCMKIASQKCKKVHLKWTFEYKKIKKINLIWNWNEKA